MATPTAVWRIRAGGSDTNGGGYDGTAYAGGTDYTDQDAAQATFTNLSCSGGTTLVDASSGGLFTAAMVGNAILITSNTGNWLPGAYFITSRINSNTVVLDGVPCSASATTGAGKVGGAWASPVVNIDSTWAIGGTTVASTAKPGPGNTVYIRGAGSDSPSTPDYVEVRSCYLVGGDTVNGTFRIVGYNGRPLIQATSGSSFWLIQTGPTMVENIYLQAGSAMTSYGCLYTSPGASGMARNVVFDQNGFDTLTVGQFSGTLIGCEFLNSGSTPPSPVQTSLNASPYSFVVIGCSFHDLAGNGILIQGVGTVAGCVFARNTGVDIAVFTSAGGAAVDIAMNTFYSGLRSGIYINTGYALALSTILSNIFSNKGTYGIEVVNGTATANDRVRQGLVGNAFYSNTSGNVLNMTVGGNLDDASNTTGTDPQFNAPSNLDFTIGTNLRALGFPPTAMDIHKTSGMTSPASPRSYVDPGAFQRQESTGTLSLSQAEVRYVS